jgi:hypothetical protein
MGEGNMKRSIVGILVCMLFLYLPVSAQAEPHSQSSPVTDALLKGALITGGAIGKALGEGSPTCSQSLEKCWDSHGLNKDNVEQVQDACWKETTACPQVCKDQYFSYREAGMKSARAEEKVLFGQPPCSPDVE